MSLNDPYKSQCLNASRQFVVVEGLSGVGKSTVTDALIRSRADAILQHTVPDNYRAFQGIASGYGPLPQLLFYLSGLAASSELIQRHLASHSLVIADRYADSVFANHAAVNNVDIRDTLAIADQVIGKRVLRPNIVVYLTCSHASLRSRIASKDSPTSGDLRIAGDQDLFNRIDANYRSLAGRHDLWMEVDTTGMSRDEVVEAVNVAIQDRTISN